MNRAILLLTPLALLAGLALGIFLAWGPMSSAPVANQPADLRREHKEQYIRLLASAYAQDGDLRRARAQLEALDAGNPALWVADLAVRSAREGESRAAAHLARLALDLGVRDEALGALIASPTPDSGAGGDGWRLVEQGWLTCGDFGEGTQPLLRLQTLDEQGSALPNVALRAVHPTAGAIPLVTDAAGQVEMPFTGRWTLELGRNEGVTFSDDDLIARCESGDDEQLHGLRLIFQRQARP